MTTLPADYLYSAEHEWVNSTDISEGDVVRVGITRYAVEALGEVVYVELPEVGDTAEAGEPCGEVESTKTVSDIFAPVSGEIVAVNEALADDAAILNEDPYEAGWIYEIEVTDVGDLMDSDAYAAEIA